MHYMPDTDEEDYRAETFWPESFKQVIRGDIRQLIEARLSQEKILEHAYQKQFPTKYTDLKQFSGRIADMLVIGAENGADDAIDAVISAFWAESSLPEVRKYGRYLWPQLFPQKTERQLQQVIAAEYSQDEVFKYAYRVGYAASYQNFEAFIGQVSRLLVTGAVNSTDDMLEAVYRSLTISRPLPPARRRSRRLRNW